MKNYTSSVPVERTVAEIERVLAKGGATHVAKQYQDGEVVSLTFTVFNPVSRREMKVRLPANPPGVAAALEREYKRTHSRSMSIAAKRNIEAQAARTAWRLMLNWLEVQLSLIEMEQAEFTEIFLPYIMSGKQTFYNQLKQESFKMLPPAKEES